MGDIRRKTDRLLLWELRSVLNHAMLIILITAVHEHSFSGGFRWMHYQFASYFTISVLSRVADHEN